MTQSVCVELPSKWEDYIEKIIHNEKYTQYEIEKRNISTDGGNFIAALYEVDVKGETIEGKKDIHLFVKNISLNESESDKPSLFPMSEIQNNELFIYNDLLKVFDELQDLYNVPLEERYKTAKCYVSQKETIVMENLSMKGFKTYNRMDVIPLKFAELCFKAIAKFHGLSFVLREKRPDYFNEKIKTRKFPVRDMSGYCKGVKKLVFEMLDEDTVRRINHNFNDLGKEFIRCHNVVTSNSTLCHADFRPNNILTNFKDGEPAEVIPIDYQLILFGCPVIDLYFYLYLCTDREFRKAHLSHLKDVYHETMTTFLKYFDIDINQVFPKKDFLIMFDEHKEFGLLVGLLILPLMFASSDDLPDLTGNMSEEPFKTDDRLKARLLDVIEDYKEWGIL